jgi:hypothetical protein
MILALALGAPVAGGIHLIAATARVKSSVLTAGVANPAVSVAEDGVSIGAIVIALLAPILALIAAVIVLVLLARFAARRLAKA